jgi:Holliday junction DNA helicase RuvA
MISRVDGTLESVADGRALVRQGQTVLEVLVPACDEMRLAAEVGSEVSFHTLHYLESQGQGASYWPRLIGFATPDDRAFFDLFTSVKGIGNRKALRSLQLPIGTIAEAIANRDLGLLVTLPEIGRKTAETIVVELKEKVGRFLGSTMLREPKAETGGGRLLVEAIAVLVQLGENRPVARQLVDRALAADPTLATADEVVTAALRLRELG